MGKQKKAEKSQRNHWPLMLAALAAIGLLFLIAGFRNGEDASDPARPKTTDSMAFDALAAEVVARAQASRAQPLPENAQGPVYVVVRIGGIKLGEAWSEGVSWQRALREAILLARDEVAPDRRDAIDTLEICLSHGYFDADPERDRRPFTSVHRGVRGLELRYGEALERWSPTRLVAGNISFDNALRRFGKAHGLDEETVAQSVGKRLFEGDQFLVTPGEKPLIQPMFRGNHIVPPEAVTQTAVRELARTMALWMENQIADDGRMTYHYFPSRGAESKGNNMIRQFMASLSLARLLRSDVASAQLEEKLFANLNYNFQQFYRQEGELGYIAYRDKAKLGAAALAALAIWESPFREQHREHLDGLTAMVAHLQEESGAFRTFYLPADRNDNQNFYPGEALLYWAIRYGEQRDPALLRRFMRSFHHYRAWHREPANRNPAFVPWHTQAYYLVWQKTKVPALAEFIFEMNDWVLALQQWNGTTYDDMRGRFYDPGRPGLRATARLFHRRLFGRTHRRLLPCATAGRPRARAILPNRHCAWPARSNAAPIHGRGGHVLRLPRKSGARRFANDRLRQPHPHRQCATQPHGHSQNPGSICSGRLRQQIGASLFLSWKKPMTYFLPNFF